LKEQAKKIISNVSQVKEQTLTTVLHISEMVNILKNGLPKDLLTQTILGLFMLDNVTIKDVTKDSYFAAIAIDEDLKLEPKDALVVDIMRQSGIREIYSFDEHFSQIEGITRLRGL